MGAVLTPALAAHPRRKLYLSGAPHVQGLGSRVQGLIPGSRNELASVLVQSLGQPGDSGMHLQSCHVELEAHMVLQ